MSSEISNVIKLSPVTVLKADKKTDEKLSAGGKDDVEKLGSALPLSSSDSTTPTSNLKQDENSKNEPELTLDSVKQAADRGNSLLQAVNRDLEFKVDESTKRLVVKIVDSNSGEIVRQIPAEEMLAFIKRMQELEGHQGSVLQDRA